MWPQVQKLVRASLDGDVQMLEAVSEFLTSTDGQADQQEVSEKLHTYLLNRFPNRPPTEKAVWAHLEKLRLENVNSTQDSPQLRRRRRKSMA